MLDSSTRKTELINTKDVQDVPRPDSQRKYLEDTLVRKLAMSSIFCERNEMTYRDLTLDQRISLKGYFQSEKELHYYRLVSLFWNFVVAVEFFLNDDINPLLRTTNDPHRMKGMR